MKCDSCGKRLKKSDEICPECGKYIVRKKSPKPETTPEVFVSEEPVCNENEVVFRDNITSLALKLGLATVPFVFCIISIVRSSFFYDASDALSDTFLIIISILLYIDAFAVFYREKGCRLTFEEDYFHGTVPIKHAGRQEISIRYDEIAATDLFEGSKNQQPHLKVFLKSDETVKITCSRKQTLCEIEEKIKEHCYGTEQND